MSEKLRALAQAREAASEARAQAGLLEYRLQSTPAYAAILEAKKQSALAVLRVADLEKEVRTEALRAFADTGNKNPWGGVQIKVYTKVDFDEEIATHWCRENAQSLLRLDTRAYKKVAPNLSGAPVTVTKEPRAVITMDLSSYLVEDIAEPATRG